MSGCKERRCPCRKWVNCVTYIDQQKQAWRLAQKQYDFQNQYYSDYFRADWAMGGIANG